MRTIKDFPWGDRDPEGGYRVGDHVGIIYSDHQNYIFDNPTGVVTAVSKKGRVTVQVETSVGLDRLFLIERAK